MGENERVVVGSFCQTMFRPNKKKRPRKTGHKNHGQYISFANKEKCFFDGLPTFGVTYLLCVDNIFCILYYQYFLGDQSTKLTDQGMTDTRKFSHI